MLPNCTIGEAFDRAEAMRILLGQIEIRGADECLSVSIGVATMFNGVMNQDLLLRDADEALYLAKSKGRNQVVAARTSVQEPLVLNEV